MNIAVIALTKGGAVTAKKLAELLTSPNHDLEQIDKDIFSVQIYLPEKLKVEHNFPGIEYYSASTPQVVEQIFRKYQGIVLIMATGIAVRSLAPLLGTKYTDPAVVVVDERGQFAISLLSGHLGGANDLARSVAGVLGGTPVITTSTDVQGRLAADVLAKELGLKLEQTEYLTHVNAQIAKGEKVLLLSDYPINLPSDHLLWQDGCWQVSVGTETKIDPDCEEGQLHRVLLTNRIMEQKALILRPQSIVVGVGCRKGVPGEVILRAIQEALKIAGRSQLSVKKLVSIEAKAGETGIHWAAEHLKVSTEFFPVEKLQEIMQQTKGLAQSQFVNSQMGVEGVCEPASLAGCRQGKIILGKQAGQGVTVALAEEEYGLWD